MISWALEVMLMQVSLGAMSRSGDRSRGRQISSCGASALGEDFSWSPAKEGRVAFDTEL